MHQRFEPSQGVPVAEDGRGQVATVQHAVPERLVAERLDERSTQRRIFAHQALGLAVAVVDRHAPFGEEPADRRLAAPDPPRNAYPDHSSTGSLMGGILRTATTFTSL